MTRGRVFLTDFGLARDTATGSRLTRTGVTLGTPAYMSPEQARGDLGVLTPASDVWALGCVLAECATGHRVFGDDEPAAVIAQVLTGPPVRLRGAWPDVPRPLDALVGAALSRSVATRPPTAGAFRDDCERVRDGRWPVHRPARPPVLRWVVGAALVAGVPAWALWPPPATGPDPTSERSAAERLAGEAATTQRGDPAGAAERYARALAQVPERWDWRLARGRCLWAAGDDMAARAEWAQIPPDAPAHARAELWLGLERWFAWRGSDALPHLERAIRAAAVVDDPMTAQVARAARATIQRDWPVARAALASLEGGWEVAALRAYVDHADPGHRAPAAIDQDYTLALVEGVRTGWLYHHRGTFRRSVGRAAEAVADLDQALALLGPYVEGLNERGVARRRAGDPQGAIADHDAAIALQPDYAAGFVARSAARADLGDLAGAADDLGRALAIAPRSDGYFNRGLILTRLGRLAEAEADFDAALVLEPDYAPALGGRADARARQGNVRGALADYDAALALDDRLSGALVNRGNLHAMLGQYSRALDDYGRALDIEPDEVAALMGRGRVLRRMQRARDALDDYLRARALRPEDAEVRYNCGNAYRDVRDLDAARAEYDAALGLQPTFPEALVNRGLVSETQGRFAEALADFERALAVAPPNWRQRANTEQRRARVQGKLGGGEAR